MLSGAQEVLQELLDDGKFEVFYFKEAAEEQDVVEEKSFNDLRSLVQVQPSHREPESITNSISCNDIVLFIYTSGTTGKIVQNLAFDCFLVASYADTIG